tara:strand:+ start:3988 stop:5424 length:1437 start_codon:yes stop_codon:yes gene_type:complete
MSNSVQEELPVAPPKMDASNVPAMLQAGRIDSNMMMDVSSDVLDPIIVNDTTCRFVLTNKGYLHDGSRITLGVLKNASVADGAFFPPSLGVNSLIRRATLSIGGNVVSETDDYNHFKAYESMFLSSEINKSRESVMSGRSMAHDFRMVETSGSQSNTAADSYGLDNGMDYNGGALSLPQFLDVNNEPTFSVSLAQLFPFMKGVNLPLFAMKQEIIIDLVWEPLSTTGRCSVNTNASSGTEFKIDTNNVKLVADYIFYDGEKMAADLNTYMTQETNFAYNDYRLTKTTLSVADAKNSVRNLGGAGRMVTKIITGINDDNRTDRFILNKYSAVAPDRDYTSPSASNVRNNGTLTANVRMNDFFVFPIDLSNSAVLFDKTTRAEGGLPFVTREEYSAEGDVLTSATFEGTAQNASKGLLGNFFFQSYKLPAGRVNARGLELTTKMDSLPALAGSNTYTQRTWIEIGRVAQLKGGFLTSGFR